MKERTIRVLLDGREVFGFSGQRLLDLCAECGVEIPALCYDPHLSIHGGCSICLVEVKGAKALARACATTIVPDMEVTTRSERVRKARKLGLELLLSDHVGDCRPPCTLACPGRGDVQGYVNLAAQGKWEESLEALRRNITLPASIGRVCPAPCEKKCRRNLVDDAPVSIREIKRVVGDLCLQEGTMGHIPEIVENGKRVAVVGAGPAGLSAALFLRRKGYGVDLYDKEPLFGGMMRYGIPDYRLPQEVLQAEIEWILANGVTAHPNTALGRDVSLEELRETHDAVLLTLGCWKSSPLRCAGENLPGVWGGIDFLYKVNRREPVAVGRRVAVVGGGNTAMDAARCARRYGAEKVFVVYRRTQAEMPAEPVEIQEAMEEGVEFLFLAAPKAVEGVDRAERLVCEKMALGDPDASGRRSPVPTGETFVLEVDTVVAAIGQAADFSALPKVLHDGRRPLVDENYATPLPGVFATGDFQTGPDIAVAAMGGGHWASESIHTWLTTGVAKRPFEYDVVRKDLTSADFAHVERTHQEHPHHDAPEVRLEKDRSFQEFNHGLTPEQCTADAARCMECGCGDLFECKLRRYAQQYEVNPDRMAGAHVAGVQEVNGSYVRNMDKCILCGRCVRVCDEVAGFHAIDFTRRGFEGSVDAAYWRGTEGTECTQCGLCVQLCPVGALMEKRAPRKPHSEIPQILKTACGRCGVGCQLELNLDADRRRVVRVTTDFDDPTSVSGGQSCALGRFGDEEIGARRLTGPQFRGAEGRWNTLLDNLGEKLKGVLASSGGASVAVVAGGSLGNEEYLALRRLASEALPGALLAVEGVDAFAPARQILEKVWKHPLGGATYADVRHADAYFLLESDTDRTHPVLTSWMRVSMRKNHAALVYIGADAGKLDRGDALVLSPREGTREDLLRGLSVAVRKIAGKAVPDELVEYTPLKTAALTGVDGSLIEKAAHLLAGAKRLATLVGQRAGSAAGAMDIAVALLETLNQRRVLLLHEGSNAAGAALLNVASASVADVVGGVRGGTLKALITVGVDPAALGLGDRDLAALTVAAAMSTESLTTSPDYVFPMADWRERDGSAFTLAGVRVEQVRAIPAPGFSAELCWTVAALARRLGKEIPARMPLILAGG